MNKGHLYLIPTPLGDTSLGTSIPEFNHSILHTIRHFIVEDLRTARRFLKQAGYPHSIDSTVFLELNEHTRSDSTTNYLQFIMEGHHTGLMSEAGLPCVADPGHIVVRSAHVNGVRVIPLVGPSSLLLTLMGSGLNGQGFVFHGYLPVRSNEREASLKRIERDLIVSKKSQLFIETPYRNNALLECILKVCHADTLLCIGSNLMEPNEIILTRPIASWKKNIPDLNKRPSVFILGI